MECEGHSAGPHDPMGETVYCDGSCNEDLHTDDDGSNRPTTKKGWLDAYGHMDVDDWPDSDG